MMLKTCLLTVLESRSMVERRLTVRGHYAFSLWFYIFKFKGCRQSGGRKDSFLGMSITSQMLVHEPQASLCPTVFLVVVSKQWVFTDDPTMADDTWQRNSVVKPVLWHITAGTGHAHYLCKLSYSLSLRTHDATHVTFLLPRLRPDVTV